MSVISLAGGEESLQGVVARNSETGKVGEELSSNVEEDGEEVESCYTEDDVDLGDGSRLLKLVEVCILGKLQSGPLAVAQAGTWIYSAVKMGRKRSRRAGRRDSVPPCRAERLGAVRGPGKTF